MKIIKTKLIEVPPVDLSTQQRILNLFLNDMQRNGMLILSITPDGNPGVYLIEYKDEDLVEEENEIPDSEVDFFDSQ